MATKIGLCLLVVMVMTLRCTSAQKGRGRGLMHRFFPEITVTPKPEVIVPVVRKARGDWLSDKFQIRVRDGPKTTVTTTTTTKSPEQIREEQEIIRKRKDPKGFLKKFSSLLIDDVEEEAEKMKEKLHDMLDSCTSNADCGNSTCCYKEDKSKPGKCLIKPHKIDHKCSDICGCENGDDLECKLMEISEENEDSPIKQTRQCKKKELDGQAYLEKVLDQIKRTKAGLSNPAKNILASRKVSRGSRTHRITFV